MPNSVVSTQTLLYIGFFIVAFQSYGQKADFEHINFQAADNIALECKNEGLDNLPLLAYKLTSRLTTDAERFRAIYKWVCLNIANDYRMYEKNMRKRHRFKNDSIKLKNWNERFRKQSFKTLLKDKRTICTGYAYLVKELSRLANINCEIVNGYGKTSTTPVDRLSAPNHSWNAVELNGTWYLCDPTWASGTPNASNFFEFNYNDGYFLAHPKLFAVNHHPIDTKWLLIDDEPTFEDFLEAPIIYGKAYTHLSRYDSPKKMHNELKKNEKVIFVSQLLKNVPNEDVTLLIDNGSSSKKVHPKTISINNTSLIIEYIFEHTGFYDVHLYIGQDLIATHTFRVKN